MRTRTPVRVSVAVVAVLLATGCTSHKNEATAASRPSTSASVCAAAGESAADDAPSPGAEGGGPLPAEVRCLPGVVHGDVGPAPDLGDGTGAPGSSGSAIVVGTSPDVDSAGVLALCQKLTRLGYGPGGKHHFAELVVMGFPPAGDYLSSPGRPDCVKQG